MNENLNRIINNKLLVFRILWLGITSSVLIFVGLSYYLSHAQPPPPESLNDSMSTVFLLMAVSSFAVSLSLGKFWNIKHSGPFNRDTFIESKKNLRTQHGQAIWSEKDIQTLTTFTDTELLRISALEKGFIRFIMELVTAETCGLLGFLTVYLSGQFLKILPFAAMSLAALLLKWPTEEKFK